ncbi:DNA polymerase III subunit delta [Paenibacillus sp. N1-5-1-14]|uniref:DNA polymerase III subunit delta n=1 Tax=Paenibacillus radicibacter TaxID=2972488 RepID=UPI00215984E4|nr:DNA polymerase III subunit delta [Paenibacillus radicibacter]MCR8645721.1 DNA polymerase III subunit delta [Paenibacillus radicibacter]
MDYRKVAKDIGAGKTLPVYLCYGPEKYLMQQFIDYMTTKLIEPEHRDFAISKFDLAETSIETVIEDTETLPFMVPRKIVIAKNATFFTGARDQSKVDHNLDKLTSYLKSPVDYSILVFIVDADKLDERKTIVKTMKAMDAALPFLSLSPEGVQDWVLKGAAKEGFTFEPGALDQLILSTGGNLQSLSAEIEKLSLYLGGSGVVTQELVDELVVRSAEQNVFLLVEEVVRLRLERAFMLLEQLLKQKEEPIKIMMLIARQFRIMLQVKELSKQSYSQGQIASQLGLHPFAVKVAEGQARNFEIGALSRIIGDIADLDYQMKTGGIDKVLGMEMFLLGLAQVQARG